MGDHVYKKIELVGTSTESSDAAVRAALRKAGESVRNMRWFEIVEVRGEISGSDVAHWQATINVGFRVDE